MPKVDESEGREVQAEAQGLPIVNPDALNQPSRGTDDFTSTRQQILANPHVILKGETADGNHPVIASTRAQEAPRVSYDDGAMVGGREWIATGQGGVRRMTDEDVEAATKQDRRAVRAQERAAAEGAPPAEVRAEGVRVHEETGLSTAADDAARKAQAEKK